MTIWYVGTPHNDLPPLAKFLYPSMGFWNNVEKDIVSLPEKIYSNELSDNVVIKYDKLSIPHIEAKNDHDLYFAQGYVTAYHRLWQMEFNLRKNAGYLAEIMGAQQLDSDRLQRRKGVEYGAKMTLADLQKNNIRAYEILDAYVKGVNAYIQRLSYTDYPLEFKLLNIDPMKWENHHPLILLTEAFMSHEKYHSDILRTNTLRLARSDLDSILFGSNLMEDSIFIPKEGYLKNLGNIKIMELPLKDDVVGSQFVISNEKTLNNRQIVAFTNTAVLDFKSFQYMIELKADNIHLIGNSIPGIPSIIGGMNDDFAWNVLPGNQHMVSWYNLSFSDDHRNEYFYDSKLLKTQQVIEKINVKDQPALYDTVIYTHYGPVVYDQRFRKNKANINLAAQWYGHNKSDLFQTLIQLGTSKSITKVQELKSSKGPLLNLLLIDNKDMYHTYFIGSHYDKRDYHFIRDGKNSALEATYKEHIVTEASNSFDFISFAGKQPRSMGDYQDNYMDRRLHDRLSAIPNVRIEDIMNVQNDNFNFVASIFLPATLSLVDEQIQEGTRNDDLLSLLKKWDFFNQPQMVTPTIFNIWWNNLRVVYQHKLGLGKPDVIRITDKMILEMVLKSIETEETKTTLINSFKKAAKEIESITKGNKDGHKWYAYKNSKLNTFIAISDDEANTLETGGCNQCLNYSTSSDGTISKMILELDQKGNKVWASYLGSQSSNAGNSHYLQFNNTWKKGQYYEIELFDQLSSSKVIKEVHLIP